MPQRYRLRDLLVLVAACACLCPLIVSAIHRARVLQRKARCQDNLRVIGVGLYLFSMSDRESRFCTGAADFLNDGSIDSYGWLADLSGNVDPERLLDPANPLRGTGTLEDLLAKRPSDADPETPAERLYSGIVGKADQEAFLGTEINTPARASVIAESILSEGFNTNYCVSWHLARTDVRMKFDPTHDTLTADDAYGQFFSVGACMGPMTSRLVDRSRIQARNLPFIGCAGPDPWANAVLSRDLTAPRFGAEEAESILYSLSAGESLAAGFTRGPAYWSLERNRIDWIRGGETLDAQRLCESRESSTLKCASPTGPAGNRIYLQDTRGWAPVHAGSLNLLMADGSVSVFEDLNGDHLLNPGFAVPTGQKRPASGAGFRDGTVELPPMRFYGGAFFREFIRACLEC